MNLVALPGLSHQWLYGKKKSGILAFHESWKYFGESSDSGLTALSCYPAYSQTSPSYSFHLTSNKYFKYLQDTFFLFLVELVLVVPPDGLAQTRKPFYSNHFVVCPESEYTLCFKENNQRKISESSDIPICSQEFLSNWWCFWDIFQRKCLRNPACFRPTRRCWDISESAVLCSVSLNHSAGGLRFTFACPSQCIPPVITVWRSLR